MAAGAISADAARPSLDSAGFYWVSLTWGDVQILELYGEKEEKKKQRLVKLLTAPLMFQVVLTIFTAKTPSALFK